MVKFDIILSCRSITLNVFCLPVINFNIVLPNLSKIMKEFKMKGYNFADKYLIWQTECIGIQFGNKSGFCIPETEFYLVQRKGL